MLLLILTLSAVSGAIGALLGRTRFAPWLLGLGILWAFFYALFLYDRLFLVRFLPHPVPALVAGSCLLLPTTVGLAALAAPRLKGTSHRRATLLTPLILGGAWHALSPFLGSPPATDSAAAGEDEVVRQTSDSSCSAASAATILNYARIDATESELANLCLTRISGTPMLGVYRGLRQKTAGTPWTVSVLSHANLSELRRSCQYGPVLLSVGLDRWQRGYDPRYVTEWGWTPGKRHAVVLFGFLPDGKLDIGDPSIGREKWEEKALTVLWNGEGIQLRLRGQ
ncbi:MAG: hypothetical protein QM758_24480 [Armatimonas sp.]